MLLRIRREIFRAGEFETHEIDSGSFREDICSKYHLDIHNTEFYDDTGMLIKEDAFCGYSMITAVQKPAELSTVALVASAIALVAGGISLGYMLYWQKHGNQAKVIYSNSLRGAQNPVRPGGPVGILLGNYRVPLDMAGMVYSSVENNKQFVHELFCAGYRPVDAPSPYDPLHSLNNDNCGVVLRTDMSQTGGVYIYGGEGNPHCYKAWIGDTPFGSVASSVRISASEEHELIQNFPYYNRRCIEDSLSLKLLNADINKGGSLDNILLYQAPSGCYRIGVCMCAPYGYYKLDNHGNQKETLMSYNIQVREVGTENWTTVYRMNQEMNRNEFRYLHQYTLTNLQGFSIDKRYEVRVWMDDGDAWNADNAEYNTTMTVEFIQYDTANVSKYPEADATYPVNNSAQYELVDMKAQATDKLTGYIDQLYIECFLQCRAYMGDGSETDDYWEYWVVPSSLGDEEARIERMSNPAAVLLYLLTNKNVNPRALTWEEAKTKIDWVAFRDWYLFCMNKGWTCNAWVTDQMLIGQLCDLVCSTGRATFRTINGKYSVLLACENSIVTQMFTPRNAWDMQMSKNFEKPLDAVKVEFVDESTWTNAERTAYVDENNHVVIDEDITDMEDQLTVESFAIWGVTRPKQIADLEAYQLLQKRLQVRTYSWKCALEGVLCSIGDVVYMANDNFLYSLGYGRIKSLKIAEDNVVGVYVDESVGVESGHSYGITVRQNGGDFTTYPIVSVSTDEDTFSEGVLLTLATPIPVSSADVAAGNLFMYGDSSVAGKKLLITSIQYDGDKNATIEAVDYIPEIFQALDGSSWVVPAYVSGISKYGSGANFAKGAVPVAINNPPTSVHLTDLYIESMIQGADHKIEYALSTSPFVPPASGESTWGANDSQTSAEFSYGHTEDEDDAYGFPDVFDWGDNYSNWYKGLYVWQRLKSIYTDENGNTIVTYSEPVYCREITESLINGCSFDIVASNTAWEKNVASSASVTIEFIVTAKSLGSTDALAAALAAGDGVVITPYKNNVALTPLITPTPIRTISADNRVTYAYSLSFSKALDADGIVIRAAIRDTYINPDVLPESYYTIDTEASITLTANDVSVADPFGGLFPPSKDAVSTVADADALAETFFTSEYEGVIYGATYSLNLSGDNYLSLRTYTPGGWVYLSISGFDAPRVSAICGKAQRGVLANVEEGSVSAADFGYFNIVIANIVTASFIGSKQIQLQPDEDNNPGMLYGGDVNTANPQGQRVTGKGFYFDSNGYAEVSDLRVKGNSVIEENTEIQGQIINKNPSDNKVVFKTFKDDASGYEMAASKVDGTDTPAAFKYSEWWDKIESMTSGLTDKQLYSASGDLTVRSGRGTAVKTVAYVRKMSSVSTTTETIFNIASGTDSSQDVTKPNIWTNNLGKTIVLANVTIESQYSANMFGTYDQGDTWMRVLNSDGTVYRDYGVNDDQGGAYSNVYVPAGGRIWAYWGRSTAYSYSRQPGRITGTYKESSNFKTGINICFTDGNSNITTSLEPGGYGTVAQSFSVNGSSASITFTAAATWPTGVYKYYNTLVWTTSPQDGSGNPPPGVISSSLFQSQSFSYAGVSKNVSVITFSSTSLVVQDTDGVSYTLTSGYYTRAYSLSIETLAEILGARSRNLMPVYENGAPFGGGYVGSNTEPWAYMSSLVFHDASRRDLKEEILPFEKNALDIIKQVAVATFFYKAERNNPDKYRHIGFIADDTPEELSTPKHDSMDLSSCIGVLIKAVQELHQEIEKLKGDEES